MPWRQVVGVACLIIILGGSFVLLKTQAEGVDPRLRTSAQMK